MTPAPSRIGTVLISPPLLAHPIMKTTSRASQYPASIVFNGDVFIRITRVDNGAVMFVHPSDINCLEPLGRPDVGMSIVALDGDGEHPVEYRVLESVKDLESAAGVKLTS